MLMNFCNFFQNFVTPRDAWGVPGALGGPPRKGYPTWVPPGNNLDILRFWNILELFIKHNKQKNGTYRILGGPAANWGGVLGGWLALGDPRGLVGPVFFACYA